MSSKIIPTMRYRDAPKMMQWLCNAFGFEKHFVVEDGAGGLSHAQLTFADSMIMIGSVRNDEFGRLQSTPSALGGNSQSAYIVVPDADETCTRAKTAGAEIVRATQDEDYGGRAFSCLDPEGHLWNFGTYDPWKAHV